MSAVEVEGLRVTYQRWGQRVEALAGVDVRIEAGEWLLLVGHNGSGKSTLLRTLAGHQRPDAGRITVAGAPLATDRARRRRQVFLVRQDPTQGTAPMLTLFENLLIADPDAPGHGRKALAARYAADLAPIGLDGRLHQLASTLSGGERQLLALLIARRQPAPVLLLDEPFAALDPGRVRLALDLLRGLHAEGRTLVQVSHDPEHIASLGDRALRLDHGRVVAPSAVTSASDPP
ncbi:MAG: ABC transporter ATP-binding protein [Myxococcales bacterium]|nr:ABC transporter ATP-binding protein [Myxococcales bacterium]